MFGMNDRKIIMLRGCCLVLLAMFSASPADGARIKDIANIRGIRSNQLIGYGIVVGLAGTGDDQQVYFTLRSVQLLLRRLGVQAAEDKVFDLKQLRTRNTAAVMVTAELPPFAKTGTRIDVTVSSLGNASSLVGGVMLMTPLRGVDLKVYALAQGGLSVGGYIAEGKSGSKVSKNHTVVARLPQGAIVEKEVTTRFIHQDQVVITLQQPDFTTASRLTAVINQDLKSAVATTPDPGTIQIKVPKEFAHNPVELVSRLEMLQVDPDMPAQVVINERTGIVVVGQDVRLSRAAIAYGNLTLEINEKFKVSQPTAPFGAGNTAVVPRTQITATESNSTLRIIDNAVKLSDVVKALNALNASPRDLIAIFQALSSAGALPAKLVVQ